MITIKIETDNDAFQNGFKWIEIVRILRVMIEQQRVGRYRDGNGNVVATLEDDDE